MQREEIEEIVRQVISKMNNEEISGKTKSLDDYLEEDLNEVLSDIDFKIEMVRRYHSTLKSAIAAVIPNEDPHVAVLEEVNRWMDIARAAQIGELRNERNSVLLYTPEEIEEILSDGDILDSPSDSISLELNSQANAEIENSFNDDEKKVVDRKSTRLNSSHVSESRMPSSA